MDPLPARGEPQSGSRYEEKRVDGCNDTQRHPSVNRARVTCSISPRVVDEMAIGEEPGLDPSPGVTPQGRHFSGLPTVRSSVCANASRSEGSLSKDPRSGHHLVDDAANRGCDDGRDFHIASATVSPKPSSRLFWTTTVA